MVEITRDDITQSIEFQGRKRLTNARFVVEDAADELGDKEVPDHELDPDWAARFFNDIQDVSSEEMQSLWAKVFLAATADGWLTCFVQGTSGCIPEPALERRILEPARLEPFLKRCLDQNIAHGAQLFSVLPNVLEDRFIVWLGQVLDSYKELSAGAVEHLGQIVVARNWSKALDILVQQFRNNRRDLLPALRICSSMLSVWDRWWLGITSLTKADKWDLFDEIAVELYPSGPDQDELWERAGGRNGDLEKQGTGSIRWKAVLRQMARGQNPRPAKLLSVMLRDYPSNDRLRFLANDHEFCEWLF